MMISASSASGRVGSVGGSVVSFFCVGIAMLRKGRELLTMKVWAPNACRMDGVCK